MSSFVVAVNPIGWLRNARFDLTLIVGVALLALTAGALVVLQPHWFYVLLALDLWLLGYPHVIATFTRLSFDMDSFRQNKFLVLGLPWIICAGTVAMGIFSGFGQSPQPTSTGNGSTTRGKATGLCAFTTANQAREER